MTLALYPLQPVDYLIIGHITQDLTPNGPILGGTASYSSRTARAFGLRVGIVTSCAPSTPMEELEGIQIVALPADHTTTFENVHTPSGRVQHIYHIAEELNFSHIPGVWRTAPIVHLAPLAQEIDPTIVRYFPNAMIGVTPQGWMRNWDSSGVVHFSDWNEAGFVLEHANAAVLSIEDVQRDESRIEEMLSSIRVLVVTEGAAGARVYWNGDIRYFRPPVVDELDPVGAGDIFAAAFFVRYQLTKDPWEAARFATLVAAKSVTRKGIAGTPTIDEIQNYLFEVLPGY